MSEDISMTSGNSFGYARKVREPEVYNGERDTIVVDSWIYSLELYFSLVKIEHPQEKLLYAVSLLRKDAQLWYSQLNTFEKEHAPQDWDELKVALRTEFVPIDTIAKARDNMASLVQTTTVNQYINDFRRLLLQIPDMSEGVAQDKFVRGLVKPLRYAVRSQFPKTLADAQRIALAIESADEGEVVQSIKASAPQPQYEAMDLDAIRDLVNALNGGSGKRMAQPKNGRRNFNNGNFTRNTDVQCYNCKGWGHMQGECPSPRSNRGGNRRSGDSLNNRLKE
jgi:hypothetical protein